MEVRICFDQPDPPVGRLRLTDSRGHPDENQAIVSFCGWLGLLRALSDVLGSAESLPAQHGRGREDTDDRRAD